MGEVLHKVQHIIDKFVRSINKFIKLFLGMIKFVNLKGNIDRAQTKRYAEDLVKLYVSEKNKRTLLEHTNRQLKKYAKDLSATYKQKIDQERIRFKLARYLSPSIVESIIRNKKRLVLGGEQREVTVLFADIRKFTSISEMLNMQDIVGLLNNFFSLMTDIIFKYDGTVDKSIGDCIMVIFGAPFEIENHAVSAVNAAIEMQNAISRRNKKEKKRDAASFEIGVGINSGKVIAGNIGSEKRMDYTVIGDVVNVASRIQVLAKSGQILIGQRTWELIKDSFHIEEFGKSKLKNREKIEKIYEINFTIYKKD